MIDDQAVKDKFHQACIKEGRRIGLIFGEAGGEVSSVKIISYNNDPADWLAVARYAGRHCVAIFELDEIQSKIISGGVNLRTLEGICCKLAASARAIVAGELDLMSWLKGLSRAEITLAKIIDGRGVLIGITDKVVEAALAA